jgi:hypothetical protein
MTIKRKLEKLIRNWLKPTLRMETSQLPLSTSKVYLISLWKKTRSQLRLKLP